MKVIAFDLGTGGIKASLYDERLQRLNFCFHEYETFFPKPGWHEQRPQDWWNGVKVCTQQLLAEADVEVEEIAAIALSGHSLVAVPMDAQGKCLADSVPIWSDMRAEEEAGAFFEKIEQEEWYMTTGNGFPPATYTIFKLAWMKKYQPEIWKQTKTVLGSKDYVNYLLTGEMAVDESYLSGCGAYNLREHRLEQKFLDAAGVPSEIFPKMIASHEIVGRVSAEAAKETGFAKGTLVACGGVDNACMALGAVGCTEGRTYVSLGTSSWIPVNTKEPLLDVKRKPYVFAHIEEGMYTSAMSIFSGGNSFRWVRDVMSEKEEKLSYDELTEQATHSVPGAHGVLFHPALSGGSSQDKSPNIRGAFLNLELSDKREDLIRATLEGITMNLKTVYDFLSEKVPLEDDLIICGGGSRSDFWMQLFADIFDTDIRRTNVDQDAASLGAAAIAARGAGLITNYRVLEQAVKTQAVYHPDEENSRFYHKHKKIFDYAADMLSDFGDFYRREQKKF